MKTNSIQFKKGRDINGNSLIKITRAGYRGFSIQSNGNLPLSHRATDIDYNTTLNEVQQYVELFGTEYQKQIIK